MAASFLLAVFCLIVPAWGLSNPFCGYMEERDTVMLEIYCQNGVIDSLSFAAFGTPNGYCPNFSHNASCDDPTFMDYAKATCIGQTSCVLESHGGDPCPEVIKSIAVVAHCSQAPGGGQVSPLPKPSCAVNGLPCPVPRGWAEEATWNLTESTVIQPSSAGFFSPAHPWGLVSLDWSVANTLWFHNNVSNSTCEAISIEGCRRLKASGRARRCFIYHNMELALQWLESQRVVMQDPALADYFIQYTDGHGKKLGRIYNEPINFGSQFFWDFRSPAAREYFVESVLGTMADPAVDGTFTDDVNGVPEEHDEVQKNTGMSSIEIADLQYNTQLASQELIDALALHGKGNWQAFGYEDGTGPAPSRATCTLFMREYCQPSYQGRMMLMSMSNDPSVSNQTVAAFLVVRPPVAFLGWGWESGDEKWNNIFLLQVGKPLEVCREESPGVFVRQYTLGTASLDCNNWVAHLPFSSLY